MRRQIWILGLDAILVLFLALWIFFQHDVLFLGAIASLGAILWVLGHLRFRWLRRTVTAYAVAVWNLVRHARPSQRALVALGSTAGAIVVLVLLNELGLAAPGKGRGLSLETQGLTFQSTFSSEGSLFVAVLVLSGLVLFFSTAWYRLFQEIDSTERWQSVVVLACFAAFLLLPILLWIVLETMAPRDPEANAKFSVISSRVALVGMTAALAAAVAVPQVVRLPAPTRRP